MSQNADGGSVLVTGAAGFVGSRLVERLAADGVGVIAVDAAGSAPSAEMSSAAGVEFANADLRDAATMDGLVARSSHVVHLAAVRMQASDVDQRLSHEVNVDAVYDLVASAARHGVKRFIYGSSHTVYGAFEEPDREPFREDETGATGRGLNMYAATKLAVEAYLEAFATAGQLEYLSLRFGAIYGPRLSSDSFASILQDMLKALDAGRRPIAPWSRDSLHAIAYIDDVVDAVVCSLETRHANLAVNVVGAPISSGDLYSTLVRLYGDDPEQIDWLEQRARYQVVDRNRLQRLLGLRDQTPMEVGLERLIEWHRSMLAAGAVR